MTKELLTHLISRMNQHLISRIITISKDLKTSAKVSFYDTYDSTIVLSTFFCLRNHKIILKILPMEPKEKIISSLRSKTSNGFLSDQNHPVRLTSSYAFSIQTDIIASHAEEHNHNKPVNKIYTQYINSFKTSIRRIETPYIHISIGRKFYNKFKKIIKKIIPPTQN